MRKFKSRVLIFWILLLGVLLILPPIFAIFHNNTSTQNAMRAVLSLKNDTLPIENSALLSAKNSNYAEFTAINQTNYSQNATARSFDRQSISFMNGVDSLTSVTDLAYSSEILYATDGRYIWSNDGTTAQIIFENTEGTIDDFVVVGDLIVYSKADLYLYVLDLNSPLGDTNPASITEYYTTSPDPIRLPDGQKKLTASATGEIFVIFNNFVARLDSVTASAPTYRLNYVSELFTDTEFSTGGFFASENGNKLWYSASTEIFCIDLENATTSQTDIVANAEIRELAVDVLGNIFYLTDTEICKNDTTTGIDDYTQNAVFDFASGAIFATNGSQIVRATDNIDQDFMTNYSTQPAPIELADISASTQIFEVVKVNAGTNLYFYSSLTTRLSEYDTEKNLLLLSSDNADFYYILDTNYPDGSGFITGYIEKTDATILENSTTADTARVVVASTKLYILPSSVALYENYTADLQKITYGKNLTILFAPAYPTDSNGATFFAVQIENDENVYYIDSRTVVGVEFDNDIPNQVVYNTSLRADTIVYSDQGLTTECDTIKKGTMVAILETVDGVAKIEYQLLNENNEVIDTAQGYIPRSFLNDGTLNATQIVGIVLMCVSLVMAIVIAVALHQNNKKKKSQALE